MSVMNGYEIIAKSKFSKFHLYMFLLLFIIMSFDGYDMVIYGATLPVLFEALKMDPAQAGLIGSCALVGAAVGALSFGFMADKIGRKKVIIICTILFSVGSILSGFSNSIYTFGFFRFIAGLGLGGVMPNVVALTTEYSPRKNRAIMVAAIFSGMQVGGILAAGMTMWLLGEVGWRVLYFIGGAPLVIVPFLLKSLPESANSLVKNNKIDELKRILHKLNPTFNLTNNVTFDGNDEEKKSSIKSLFSENRTLSTIFIWVVFFMNMYMIFGLGTWLPQLMINAGFGLGSGLLFLLTLNLGALFGSNIAGVIADRIGYRPTLVGLYLIAFLSISLLSMTTNFYAVIILVALAGIGFYGGQNVGNAYVSLFYPPSMRSTGMGFAFGLGRLGAIFGPVIAGFIVSWGMAIQVNFLALAIPGLIAAVSVLMIREKHSYLSQSNDVQKPGDGGVKVI
ncbi:aromatic acid/H+ symport family MFS transporter [Metabacillus litoralis]|uniref:MFS transporter n=2 Tax=Metabacillus litoralis TaxID=152268 RepID=UPI001B99C6E8|nr:aromatic acid/H+ symport family MFS transporter [Metabacillus litoralis]MCM3163508.1 aromatic acid/H+ symport family MFS transporter [Metabacillus litoralis]